MHYKNLLLQNKDSILTITVNRESKLNALNRETLEELYGAFKEVSEDTQIRGIIITGSGAKAFVAGADISEFAGLDAGAGRDLALKGHAVFNLIEGCGKPVIAAINGYALGGGLELAMACHIRIASDTAKMGQPEINLGLIPGYGGTQRLPALAGKGKAMEMILTGVTIDAREALQLGLVNYVTAPDQVITKAEELMLKIVNGPPLAVAAAIHAINASSAGNKNGFGTEIAEFVKCVATEDFKEGVNAFIGKRKPVFKGT